MRISQMVAITVSLVLIGLILSLITSPASAEANDTFLVTSSLDMVDFLPGDGICETASGNGMCTLRAAIMEANALIGADMIVLPAGTYLLTIPGTGEDQGAMGDLDITQAVSIRGDSAISTVIDASDLGDRAIEIMASASDDIVSISNLSVNGVNIPGGLGALVNRSWTSLSNVIFKNNTTAGTGGAIYNFGGSLLGDNLLFYHNSAYEGGAVYIYLGNASFRHTVFNSNSASYGGAIRNAADSLELIDTTIISNTASTYGGGIYSLSDATLERVTVKSNTATMGGGIYNISDLDATDSTLDNNSSSYYGGGLYNSGSTILYGCTISSNHAQVGGGIYNVFATIMQNTTITNNQADSSAGGMYNSHATHLHNSTVTNNQVTEIGGTAGGIYSAPASTTLVRNTILYGNISQEVGGTVDSDCMGDVFTGSYNLIGSLNDCTLLDPQGLDLIGVNPLLMDLADNGGPTHTQALSGGSPAIDAGNPEGCLDLFYVPLVMDQRGHLRPYDGNHDGISRCDIGAFETPLSMVLLPVIRK